MKDEDLKDDLEEAIADLEKMARESCRERNLDPEKAGFSLQFYRNLRNVIEIGNIQGIEKFIQRARKGIEDIGEGEAIMFIIDESPVYSWIMDQDKELSDAFDKADVHVRIGTFWRDTAKFFCLI